MNYWWLEIGILLRTMTIRKVWNGVLVLVSYYVSRWLGKVYHWGKPISVGIEPTTACNLRCPQCISGLRAFTRPIGRLQRENFEKLIDEIHKELIYLILYFQGEPYLNPDFLEMVAYASKKGVFTMTSTNGHFLDEKTATATVLSGLKRVVISMDGITQESYSKYRIAGELDKVLVGINNLVAAKKRLKSKTPLIDLQFIVFAHNENEIEGVKLLAKKLGVDRLLIKTAQIYDFEGGSELLPKNKEYSRYAAGVSGEYLINNKLSNHCWRLWRGCEITWDGRVLPCCFDKDAQHQMGHFPQNTFQTIWKGDTYNQFRTTILKGRKHIEMCKNCSEGTKVWG